MFLSRPSYYSNQAGEYIIIATKSDENQCKPGIYEYNLNTQKCKILYEYQSNEPRIISHGQFIVDDTLYIYGGIGKVSFKFDLISKKMHEMENKLEAASLPIIIKAGDNQLHVTSPFVFVKFDADNEKFIKCTSSHNLDRNIIYDVLTQKLIMIKHPTLATTVAYQCDTADLKTNHCKWTQIIMKFPSITLNILATFNGVLFVYDTKTKEIWFINLLNVELFKTQYCIPKVAGSEMDSYAMYSYGNTFFEYKTKDDFIHLVEIYEGIHYKMYLYDLLSNKMIQSVLKYYQPLIVGYVKRMEKANITQHIPLYLKKIILGYYPAFV